MLYFKTAAPDSYRDDHSAISPMLYFKTAAPDSYRDDHSAISPYLRHDSDVGRTPQI